jgi:hypothetical protein
MLRQPSQPRSPNPRRPREARVGITSRQVHRVTPNQDAAGGDRRFARRFLGRLALAGAAGGATLVVCGALFLAAVNPSQLRCSTWLVPVEKGAWAPGSMLAPVVALWAVSMCFGAVRWGWLGRLYARSSPRAQSRRQYALTIDFGWRLIVIVAGAALLCAAPILMAIASCHPEG